METMAASDGALLTFFAVLVAVDIIGNTFVCLVILQKRFRLQFSYGKTAMDYLLVNLALSDILFALFVIPRYVVNHAFKHPDGVEGDFLCKFINGGTLIWVGGAASVFSLLLIASDRFSAVVYPHRHKRRISKARVPVVLMSCWIFAFLLNLPLFLVMGYNKEHNFCFEEWPENFLPQAYGILWLLYGGLLPIAFMSFLYFRIIRALWFKHPSLSTTSRTHVQRTMTMLSRRKATKLCITVTAIYAACWLPILVLYIMSFHRPEDVEYGSLTYKASVAITCFNSSVNPFVYALQSYRFRKQIKDMMCCRL